MIGMRACIRGWIAVLIGTTLFPAFMWITDDNVLDREDLLPFYIGVFIVLGFDLFGRWWCGKTRKRATGRERLRVCSFCGKAQPTGDVMIEGPNKVFICTGCADRVHRACVAVGGV